MTIRDVRAGVGEAAFASAVLFVFGWVAALGVAAAVRLAGRLFGWEV